MTAEASGGANDDENAIPLCFDCHQETGAYDVKHPLGNRFSVTELKARRDQLYGLVSSGTIQAQIVATQIRAVAPSPLQGLRANEVARVLPSSAEGSLEAESVLKSASTEESTESLPLKLSLLSESDRAYVLDGLLRRFDEQPAMAAIVALIATSSVGSSHLIVLEQLLRKVTLAGAVHSKAQFMRLIPVDLLAQVDIALRRAFFYDIISMMRRDQYVEVNVVTPAVVGLRDAIPSDLMDDYIGALLLQARSGAWRGAPAAHHALLELPDQLATKALEQIDGAFLASGDHSNIKDFLRKRQGLWPEGKESLFQNYIGQSFFEFLEAQYSSD